MRKIKAFFATLLMTLVISCSGSGFNNTTDLHKDSTVNVKSMYNSVAILYINKGDNKIAGATGFAYDKDHLITANHFCLKALEIQSLVEREPVMTMQPAISDKTFGPVELDKFSTSRDFCTVKYNNHGLKPVTFADYNKVNRRDRVIVVGAPGAAVVGDFHGRILSTKFQHKNKMFKDMLAISSPIVGGVSGSPVFNMNGQVIGLVTLKPVRDFDHFALCVRSDRIAEFLDKNTSK